MKEQKRHETQNQQTDNIKKVVLTPLSSAQAFNLPNPITSIEYVSSTNSQNSQSFSHILHNRTKSDKSDNPSDFKSTDKSKHESNNILADIKTDMIEKPLVGSFPKSVIKRTKTNELTIVRVTIIMTIAIALTTWLKTDKLADYWMQKHETNQPFATMGESSVGKFGQEIERVVNENKIEDSISAFSDILNTGANHLFYRQELEKQNQLTKQKEVARQKLEQQRQDQRKARSEEVRLESLKPKPITKIEIASGQKVLFIGDSLMQGVAPWVMRQLQSKHQIDSIDLSKHSTGLAFSKFFDWPATVEKTLPENPDIVAMFVFLGGNDGQSVVDPNTQRHTRFASERWDVIYIEKIQRIIKAAERYNVQVFWMTPPNMKKKSLNKKTAHLTELFDKNIPTELGLVVHSKELLQADKTSNIYSGSMIINGKKTKVRTSDGVHFTTKGQKRLANAIMNNISINGKPLLVE